jgi:ubiquinone/menaquinone biosynthesis C-methylase UbiE
MQDIHVAFRQTDRAADLDALVDFLDEVDRLPSVRAYRQRMLDVCPVEAGQRILDVGCGIGHVALRLASFTGPHGRVVGVDKNESFIAEARRRAADTSCAVAYRVGDAERMDVLGHSFDICRAERVLMYVDRPDGVLDGMVVALRPGGRLACFELDYDGVVVDSRDRDLTRTIARLVADSVPSPWIARQLPRLLRERGLQGSSSWG